MLRFFALEVFACCKPLKILKGFGIKHLNHLTKGTTTLFNSSCIATFSTLSQLQVLKTTRTTF